MRLEGLTLHQDGDVAVVTQQPLLIKAAQNAAAKVGDLNLQQPLRHAGRSGGVRREAMGGCG